MRERVQSEPFFAGPWSVTVSETGRLTRLEFEGIEVVRGIFVVVRDEEWGTVPPAVEITGVRADADSFDITLRAEHVSGDLDFAWSGRISGSASGVIRYEFDGEARVGFLRNRIGFVVLHPLHWAGAQCTLMHPDGSITHSRFPEAVSPQQPFLQLVSMYHEVVSEQSAGDTEVHIAFEGEIFETEDQRNWSDASFKTYGTPLSLPFPVWVRRGERIHQAVVVSLAGRAGRRAAITQVAGIPAVTIHPTTRFVWPGIGVGFALDEVLSRDFLEDLNPTHLRVDLRIHADRIEGLAGLRQAARLGVPIELALHVSPEIHEAPEALATLRVALAASAAAFAAVLVYTIGAPTTDATCFRDVARGLAAELDGAEFFVGTDDNFAELNRNPVDGFGLGASGVTFALTPQIHDVSDIAVMETIEALPAMLDTARSVGNVGRVVVSPISLKPRRNIYGTHSRPPDLASVVPPVDKRQGESFTAAWTVGALSVLVAGATRLTFFEHAGPRGLAPAGDSPPAERYPVFGVLAALSGAQAGVEVTASDPAIVSAIAFVIHDRVRIILANLTAAPHPIEVHGPGGVRTLALGPFETRIVDEPLRGSEACKRSTR